MPTFSLWRVVTRMSNLGPDLEPRSSAAVAAYNAGIAKLAAFRTTIAFTEH